MVQADFWLTGVSDLFPPLLGDKTDHVHRDGGAGDVRHMAIDGRANAPKL